MKPIKYLLIGGLLATSALTAPALADGRLIAAAKQPLQAVTIDVERVGWGRLNQDFRNMGRRLLRADDDDNGSRGRRVRGWNNDDDNGSRGRRFRGRNNDDDNGRGRGRGARRGNNDDDNGSFGGRGGRGGFGGRAGGGRNDDDD